MILLNGKVVNFTTFPNGETNLHHEDLDVPEHYSSTISFKYENDGDLIKLLILRHYLENLLVPTPNLLIYYMPYSRMDRVINGGAFTLGYIADMLNGLEFNKIEVVEPHSDVTPAVLYRSKSLYVNYDLLPKVIEEVGFNPDEHYIVFPDGGAQKRYSQMKYPNVLVGNKVRNTSTGEIVGLEITGRMTEYGTKAIIVDDLSSYGGTFLKTAKALKEKYLIKEIYLLVAHAENSIFKGELFKSGLIDKVFTTNTILDDNWNTHWHNAIHYESLKVYNIEELV